jgi:hypothetical protein
MLPRSPLVRLVTAAVTGGLLTTAAVVPALADDDLGGEATGAPVHITSIGDISGPDNARHSATNSGPDSGPDSGRSTPRSGEVTARGGLALHARPDRASRVLRVAREGETVRIRCRATGENVSGNRLWYLLADGSWTWGATRFIDTAGPAPRWC